MITRERATIRRLKRELGGLLPRAEVAKAIARNWRSTNFAGVRVLMFLRGDMGDFDEACRIVWETDFELPTYLVADAHLTAGGVLNGEQISATIEFLLLDEHSR